MESLLNQARAMCPFLKRTSSATMQTLTQPGSSPGGGTISNLRVVARRRPVMSKALAVQSACIARTKHFTSAASIRMRCPMKTPTPEEPTISDERPPHTMASNGAIVNTKTFNKDHEGMEISVFPFARLPWPLDAVIRARWLCLLLIKIDSTPRSVPGQGQDRDLHQEIDRERLCQATSAGTPGGRVRL